MIRRALASCLQFRCQIPRCPFCINWLCQTNWETGAKDGSGQRLRGRWMIDTCDCQKTNLTNVHKKRKRWTEWDMPLGDTNRAEHFGSSLMTRFLYFFQVTVFSVFLWLNIYQTCLILLCNFLWLFVVCASLHWRNTNFEGNHLDSQCPLSALFRFSESQRLPRSFSGLDVPVFSFFSAPLNIIPTTQIL